MPEVQRNLGLGLIIIGVSIVTIVKTWKLDEHRNYCKNMKVEQEPFHAHFTDGVHSVEGEWEVRLTDQSDNTENLRKREYFWKHELEIFKPDGF